MLFSKYLRTQSCMPTKFPERKDSNNYFISHDGGEGESSGDWMANETSENWQNKLKTAVIASPLEKVTFLLIALVCYNKKSTLVLPIYSSTFSPHIWPYKDSIRIYIYFLAFASEHSCCLFLLSTVKVKVLYYLKDSSMLLHSAIFKIT